MSYGMRRFSSSPISRTCHRRFPCARSPSGCRHGLRAPAALRRREPLVARVRLIPRAQLFLLSNRNWYIVDTRATHSDIVDSNLHAGLDWVVETLGTPAAMRQVFARAPSPPRLLAWHRLCEAHPGACRRRRGWSTTSALRREMRSMRRRRRARARARASKRSAPGEHARL